MPARSPAISLDKFTTFGDLLKYLRRRAALTQIELAVAVSYSDTHISHLELNQRLPDLATVEARFVPALRLQDEPEAVARLLELAAAIRREDAPDPGLPPFKGLQYFDEADAGLFFGREALVAKIATRIGRATSGPDTLCFLAVVGASGSGKSSIARAGVIPSLRWIESSAQWQIHVMTPTAHPLESLAASLTGQVGSTPANVRVVDQLAQGPGGLHAYLQRPPGTKPAEGDPSALLVVDQFEELFTLCRDEAERCVFVDNLMTAAAEPNSPTHVLVTLRADFYAQCAPYPTLRNAMALQQEYIGPMTAEELQRAIEEPARRGGWELEPGLVEILLQDVHGEPGALPLLSHALLETWQRRRGRVLTLSGYVASGGVRGAIAETAEAVFSDQLNPEQQVIARNMFVRLTELGADNSTADTRRRASFDELVQHPEQAVTVRTVLTILADARLIITDNGMAEVAHEALIREWPTLRYWLEEDRNSLRQHRRLTEAAQAWDQAGRDSSELYRHGKLTQTVEWAEAHAHEMNQLERAFLAASQAERDREGAEREAQRQRELDAARALAETEKRRAQEQAHAAHRLRRRAWYLLGALVLAAIAALAAGVFGQRANGNLQLARQNLSTAQVANTQEAAQHATAEAASLLAQANAGTAQAEAESRATQQAVAQANFIRAEAQRLAAEANRLLVEQSNADVTALLSIRSMRTQYSPQGDAALEGAMLLPYPRRVFTGHTDYLNDAAYSPDGKYVLTASADKTARLWDAQTGQELRQFAGHTDQVGQVAFSPDGERVLTVSLDNTVRLWDAHTGQAIRVLIRTNAIGGAAFSPDGRYVLTSNHDPLARLWDAQTGQIVRVFTQTATVRGVAFSPDGKFVLTGSKDNFARLWDVQTGIELHDFAHPANVDRVAFSADGLKILTGAGDKIVRLWDVRSGQVLRSFVGHKNVLDCVTFSPDGKYVLSCSEDGTARLWDAQSGAELRILTGQGFFIRGAVFSPDGNYIFTAGWDKTARLWDALGGPGLPQFISQNDLVYSVAFSPDGKYVVTASAKQNMAKLWDTRTGDELREFVGHADLVQSVAFSPDGKYVLTGGGNADNTARLWDVQTGQELRRFVGDPHDNGLDVAFSPDGKYVATVSGDVRLWDAQTGEQVRTFVGHTSLVQAVAFSHDGRYLVTGSWDNTARVWDVLSGKQLRVLNHPDGVIVFGAAFSPDDEQVLSGGTDGLIRLWDTETGSELRQFTGHSNPVWSVAFSPDGKYALSGGADGTARLWDVATGAELRRFVGHTAGVESVAFSPDGKYVLTGSDDGTARLWFTDYHVTIAYLCSRVPRDFTDGERVQYNIADAGPTCAQP